MSVGIWIIVKRTRINRENARITLDKIIYIWYNNTITNKEVCYGKL